MENFIFFEKFNAFQIYYTKLLKDGIYDNSNLEACIKMYYLKNNKTLFHVSEMLDLNVIAPSANFDMYGKEFSV